MIKALAMDGNGVLYYRNTETIDFLLRYLKEEIGLIFNEDEAKSYYYSLENQAFIGKIKRKDMIDSYLNFLGVKESKLGKEIDIKMSYFSQRIYLYPKVLTTLKQLKRKGIILGVISNSIYSAEEKKQWFDNVGINPLIDIVICSVDVKCKKPEEAIYEIFLKIAGVPAREAAFMGHDEKETRGARKVGLTIISFNCFQEIADYNLKSFNELLNLSELFSYNSCNS